jgi:hypothetical protein
MLISAPSHSTSNKYLQKRLSIVVALFWGFLPGMLAAAEIRMTSADDFADIIRTLASFEDRSTGTPGCEKAAAFIKKSFSRLGFDGIGSHRFSVPVRRHGGSTINLLDRGLTLPIQPIKGNAISPEAIPPPGMEGPVIYVGPGELSDFNGKEVAGTIILMELDSGKNWLNAATLGAEALIYVDRGSTPRTLYEEKIELSPIRFPRFQIPLSKARELFGSFEDSPNGRVASHIRLTSQIAWQEVRGENIYCLVPGTDPKLREELVIVEAFYDSVAFVFGRSPGADEAIGIATLLELGRALKKTPPARSVLLVATFSAKYLLRGHEMKPRTGCCERL